MRILVADDDVTSRTMLAAVLANHGYAVEAVGDGLQALAALGRAEDPPRMALLDWMMPGLNGPEVCRRVRAMEAGRTPYLILLTMRSEKADIVIGLHAGADDYLAKPFHPEELQARIDVGQRVVELLMQLEERNRDLSCWRDRVSHELDVAGKVQRQLLATTPLLTENSEVWWAYQPSLAIGGDFFDAVSRPDGRLCVYLGDVSGHGAGPAMISTLLKMTATELIRANPAVGPAELCRMLNRYMCTYFPDDEVYATFFIAILDPVAGEWRACNCGHPRPILLGPGGECRSDRIPGDGDLPLGMADEHSSYDATVEMGWPAEPGETLILFTDGLYETRRCGDGEPCGADGLRQLAQALLGEEVSPRPEDLLARLAAAGFDLSADDCCAAMVRLVPPGETLFRQAVPSSLAAVDQVAQACEERLMAAGWPEDRARCVRLLAMEYGVNIVRHGRLPAGVSFDVQLRLQGGEASLLFRDPGPWWDHGDRLRRAHHHPDPAHGESGRGLAIVQALSSRLDIFRRDGYNHGYFMVARDDAEARAGEAASPA